MDRPADPPSPLGATAPARGATRARGRDLRGRLTPPLTPPTTANVATNSGNSPFDVGCGTSSGPTGAVQAAVGAQGRPGESVLANFDHEAECAATADAAEHHRLGELYRTHRDGDPSPCLLGSLCTRRHAWRVVCQTCEWSDWRGARAAVEREADRHRAGEPPEEQREPVFVHHPGLGWIRTGGPR